MGKDSETTTILVSKTTQKELQARKIHPNQSYDEVIQELLKEKEEA